MKLLVIGLAASGKTTLTGALTRALDLPVHRIDDYRRWLGDGTVVGEARARAAFLEACAKTEAGVFEFSGAGAHRFSVRRAFREHGAPVTTVCVWTNEHERRQRLTDRVLDIPRPDWGLPSTWDADGQLKRLKDDRDQRLWADQGWTRIDVRGDRSVEASVSTVLEHLQLHAGAGGTAGAPKREWISRNLGVAPHALHRWPELPAGLASQPRPDTSWELVSPEVGSEQLNDLAQAWAAEGWHPLVAASDRHHTVVSALSPDLSHRVAVRTRIRPPGDGEAWARRFVDRYERASAYRAASDAIGWFQTASESLDSLHRAWWVGSSRGTSPIGTPTPAVRHAFPPTLRRAHRYAAPSHDLADAGRCADRLFEYASAVRDDLGSSRGASSTHEVLERWLPRLRRILDGRDALWNFRDLAHHAGGHLRAGVVFRGSSPTRYLQDVRYADSDALERWFGVTKVVEAIDLRRQDEIDASPYPADWPRRTHHHPIVGQPVPGLPSDATPDARHYVGFFEAHRRDLVRSRSDPPDRRSRPAVRRAGRAGEPGTMASRAMVSG